MTPSRPRVVGILAGMMAVLLASGVTWAAPADTWSQPADAPLERTKPRSDTTRPESGTADREADDSAATSDKGATASGQDDTRDPRRERWVHYSSRGTRVRVGGDVVVRENERLGDVVALFGRADVKGTVSGNLFVLGGDITLAPTAVVEGDVVSVGGTIHADPKAYIGGHVSEVSLSASDFRVWIPDEGDVSIAFQPDWPRIARITFVGGIMRNLFWFIVCGVLLAIAPSGIAKVREQAGRSPLTAFAVGFAAELLFIPAIVFLAVVLSLSIIGVPLLALLPILALAMAIAMAVGFTSVAAGLGSRLLGRATPIGALVLGLAMIWGTGMAGRWLWTLQNGRFGWGMLLIAVGFAIEFIACTLGLGAALMAWSANRRARQAPAPTPAPVANGDPLSQGPLPQNL